MKFMEAVEAVSFPVMLVDNMFTNPLNGKTERGVGRQVFRKDKGIALTNVSDTYGLIPHGESLRPILQVLDGLGWSLKGNANGKPFMDHDGKRVMLKAVSQQGWNIGKLPNGSDDEVRMTLMLSNAYDRTQALKVNLGAYRLVCSNGMVVEHPAFKGINLNLKVVHSAGNVRKQFDLGDIAAKTAKLYAAMEKQAEAWRLLKSQEVKVVALASFTEKVLTPAVGERNTDKVLELARTGQGQDGRLTLWALYNGLTELYSAKVETSKTPVSATLNLNRKALDFMDRMNKWTVENETQLVTVNI